jgi:hypothetical protein
LEILALPLQNIVNQKNTIMKRILFFMIAMIICSQLFAQNKKGNWVAGTSFGSTGYSSGENESSNSTSTNVSKSESNSFYFSLNPYLGKYVTDNVVVGASVSLSPYSSKSDNSSTGSSTTYEYKTSYFYVGVGPFARFYLMSKNPKGAPYIQVNTGLNFYPGYKSTYTPNTGTGYKVTYDKYTSWNAGAAVGYEHFLNAVIGFFYTLGYSYNHNNYEYTYDYVSGTDFTGKSESHSHNITFAVGLNIHLQSLKKK